MTDRAAAAARIKGLLNQAGIAVDDLLALPGDPAPPIAAIPAPAPATPAPPIAVGGHPGFGDEGAFYDWLRKNDMLGPAISATEFKGCDAITRAAADAHWPISYTAYALATAYLETNHQMVPVREAYWLSDAAATSYFRRMYDIQGQRPDKARELGNLDPGDGAKYCGRGFPQLTGKKNYQKANDRLHALGILKPDEDIVANPELVMRPDIAAAIMIHGMAEGWFTGRKLGDFLPATGPAALAQLVPCRSIINGHDREGDVAGYAVNFQSAEIAGKWRF